MNDPTKEQEDQWRRADENVRKMLPPGVKLVRTLRGHRHKVLSIAFAPDGKVLASGSRDDSVILWDIESGKLLRTLEGHQNSVESVSFGAGGRQLASGSRDGTVKLWSATSNTVIKTLEGHQGAVLTVAFDSRGQLLASGSIDSTVKLWNCAEGRLVRTLEGHEDTVQSLGFDPESEQLASGSWDWTVRLWDSNSGKLLRTLSGHKSRIHCVAFSPKGNWLATGGEDKTVRLWDKSTGKLVRTLEGHSGFLEAIDFSADGQLLASKANDGSVRLWRSGTWRLAAVFQEPITLDWLISGLAFHPTSPLLATIGSGPDPHAIDRSTLIHIWQLDLDVLLQKPAAPAAGYASAKVVLVGESNVGKSYLAHRIATAKPPQEGAIKATHGMKFWTLEADRLAPVAKKPEAQRREVVLWDMGGQQEYRLIHQLFLHDTTVALVLLDPTRGAAAFEEVKAWNKALERQLHGRAVVKLLVGTKVDHASGLIDRQGLERLRKECGFAEYCETSALTGRGVEGLCEAVAKAIDWDALVKTTRPELFQVIRGEIERRKKNGAVAVFFDELDQDLQTNEESEAFSLMADEVAMASDAEAGTQALDAVCSQLAQQGMIARAKTSSGKTAVVLRIEEIERYAGSLILAARNNPRGVPALDLRAIVQEAFSLPGIAEKERLPRDQEKPVLECTVQLMLEHGICFQHEGLLMFPSLFPPAPETGDAKLPHAVSLYYDFAGAIDNIYASLVASLVLAIEFGKVRLWLNRAEFEVKDGGLCGLYKVERPGGFAHADLYFEAETPEQQRKEFISFVEDFLARDGVEICEHIAIKCVCGYEFAEETLRQRIARGDKDVGCPACDTRHNLTEGAAVARERDVKIRRHTWALRTRIETMREQVTKQVVQVLAKAEESKRATDPIRLLHLSDLHFKKDTPVDARLQWLVDDLTTIKEFDGLGLKELDYLVISGDFADKSCTEGFERAYEFVSKLTQMIGVSADRCIFVPGNHDVRDMREVYDWRDKPDGLKDGDWVTQGHIILARNAKKYPLRLKAFSDSFFHKFLQQPYPLDCAAQGVAIPFWETGIQFLALNSCWQVDQFHRKRSGVHVVAVANAIKQAQKQEDDARKAGQLGADKPLLRIAVWHHAVAGPQQMKDTEFLGNLQKNGVRLALHGDVHEERRDLIGYLTKQKIHVVGSGSFGARAEDRPESAPRLYNMLEIARDLKSARVHTRCQPKPDGPWRGWNEWEPPGGGDGGVPYYDINF